MLTLRALTSTPCSMFQYFTSLSAEHVTMVYSSIQLTSRMPLV
jgi:hypothetical protein